MLCSSTNGPSIASPRCGRSSRSAGGNCWRKSGAWPRKIQIFACAATHSACCGAWPIISVTIKANKRKRRGDHMKKLFGRQVLTSPRKWFDHAMCGSAVCLGKMTQEDVFKSINENVGNSGEGSGRMFLSVVLGAIAVVMLLTLLNLRRKRVETPTAVNHPGKLQKELTRQISL